ncbi:ectonucleotide pyrophosphatase/phosphodiesterase [Pedobacter alpinus]|uniref:Ectonucleotide pyrophosphatase/phosphodiesterase n=1 Tax=Pedobacter alpinus TaxID=1590643 RepID=A0ABW5TM35_9SPHI
MMSFKRILTAALMSVLLLFIKGNTFAQIDTVEHKIAGRINAVKQQKKPYVILISADGFRWDYSKKYNAKNLQKLSENGITAASMIPSFPSVTFPNHYSIITGMYPSHHGIVNNSFLDRVKNEKYSMGAKEKVRDGSWYGGTPLWVLAEEQKMIAASMFWVGSEAAIKGVRPSYYYDYNEDIPVKQRISKIKEWLMLPEEKRPHFITFYLSEPDHAGHRYGPESDSTYKAVQDVDAAIYELTRAVAATNLPVNFIFLSDHGMTAVDRENPLSIPRAIDTAKYIIASAGTMMDIHAKNKADIKPLYEQLKSQEKDYTAYLKTEMPAHFHYNATDDRMNRIGDILLIPTCPKVFSNRKPGTGYHGFDPSVVKDMHATFMAWGPAFKSGIQIPSFENVNVYPLVADILGLTYQEKIDGKLEILKAILKEK